MKKNKISINITYKTTDPKTLIKSLLKITDTIDNEQGFEVGTITFEDETIIKDYCEIKVWVMNNMWKTCEKFINTEVNR